MEPQHDEPVGDVGEILAKRLEQEVGILHAHLAAPFYRFRHHFLLLGVGLDFGSQPFQLAGFELDEVVRFIKRLLQEDELGRIASPVRVHRHGLGAVGLLDILRRHRRHQSQHRQAGGMEGVSSGW